MPILSLRKYLPSNNSKEWKLWIINLLSKLRNIRSTWNALLQLNLTLLFHSICFLILSSLGFNFKFKWHFAWITFTSTIKCKFFLYYISILLQKCCCFFSSFLFAFLSKNKTIWKFNKLCLFFSQIKQKWSKKFTYFLNEILKWFVIEIIFFSLSSLR